MSFARTRVKICGTTNLSDALSAAEAGADAIGLIFAPVSKRRIDAAAARQISLAVGPSVGRVGVFLDQSPEDVLRLADAARLSAVQIHDRYSEAEWAELASFHPVVRVVGPADLGQMDVPAPGSSITLMLDAPQPGSGQPLDWPALTPAFPVGAWLAGGLGPSNVAQAISALRPAGVDAVSALEVRPGHKDPALVRAFVEAVRRADGPSQR
ncbi:phosphoribosylanthranilate isomerase [Deinococcus psychrotolerans]|uniref:N-(5'-phosphoribosyl)anthranilate isomerase n=1 Tax=Deinococcus psychrotolerans TaxID=2489213 RepID=A0A3G8YKL2_9DEIO|nr:phosphoribosylanthranilate isomerase [Deinococcus psychrotolerans]AZI43084.1 phosphoribosylanthranilate isomerase [Deinococcus psychrotolerans]